MWWRYLVFHQTLPCPEGPSGLRNAETSLTITADSRSLASFDSDSALLDACDMVISDVEPVRSDVGLIFSLP